MDAMDIVKGHALGNDYLIIDATDLDIPIEPAWIRAICDRHFGAGADGVLIGDPAASPIGLRIFNPDGTEAEKSGNGLRIFAAFLHRRGVVSGESFAVHLTRDTVAMRVEREYDDGGVLVAVEMGRASFAAGDVGFRAETASGDIEHVEDVEHVGAVEHAEVAEEGVDAEAAEKVGEAEVVGGEVGPFELGLDGGETAMIQPVSLSNPHCVVFVDALDRADFLRRAPQLVSHPAFAAGTNVQFARVTGPNTIDAWVWERGAGETLASGSSACAIAAAARRQRRLDANAVTVRMRGGELEVEFIDDGALRLRGPAQVVYEGRVPATVLEGWRSDPPRAAE